MSKSVKTIEENKTGRNVKFEDTKTGEIMNRPEFVREIENGTYSNDYYVKKINGIKTPVSKPDGKKSNNLG